MSKPLFSVIALYTYEAQESEELSIHKNDEICVLSNQGGWWSGYIKSNPKNIGIFPYNYVKKIEQQNNEEKENEKQIEIEEQKEIKKEIQKEIKKEKEKEKINHKSKHSNSVDFENENKTSDSQERKSFANDSSEIIDSSDSSEVNPNTNQKTTRSSISSKESQTTPRNSIDLERSSEESIHQTSEIQQDSKFQDLINKKFQINKNFLWENQEKSEATISITGTEKRGKFKKYSTYVIETQPGNYKVYHRYSDFLWLQTQLKRLFPNIPFPILPEKKVTGKFKETFLENRRKMLERFLKQILSHPILSQTSLFLDFIQNDKENNWYSNQKIIEKTSRPFWEKVDVDVSILQDETSRAKFFKDHSDKFQNHVEKFGQAILNVQEKFQKMISSMNQFSKNSENLFEVLNQSSNIGFDWRDEQQIPEDSQQLKNIIISLQKLFEDRIILIQNKLEQESQIISDLLDYSTTSTKFCEVFRTFETSYSDFMSKLNSIQKTRKKNKKAEKKEKQFQEKKRKFAAQSSITLAEFENFRIQRSIEFQSICKQLLFSHIDFYRNLGKKFDELEKQIDQIKVNRGLK